MTIEEGIKMLNNLANEILGRPKRKYTPAWFCKDCNTYLVKYWAERHKRVGHNVAHKSKVTEGSS